MVGRQCTVYTEFPKKEIPGFPKKEIFHIWWVVCS